MINEILQLLPFVKGETENIRIAKGKYKQPTNFSEGVKTFKRELEWRNRNK
jgi:hypothetical protein|tara:strand:+ start:304 stop:456 length:153 start_codon:yes stop_codon:yes gene_type:complete